MTTLTGSITDGIGSNDAQGIGYGVALTDAFRTPEMLLSVKALGQAITDGIGMHDVASALLSVVIAELVAMHDGQIPNQYGQLTLAEQIFTSDTIARGLLSSVTDGIGMSPVQTVQQLVKVIESLKLQDIVAPAFTYHLSVSEQVAFADALARFIGAGVIENLQLTDQMSGSALFPNALSETLQLSIDLSSSRLLFNATLADGIEVTDADLASMIFNGQIIEGIQVAAAYLAPGGSITTWAVNTRTAAVTEYTNYAFNSFARMGDIYLGATNDGLYELVGDNDAGTSIIADLKSGMAQFADVHLTSFKAAYIATRGGGDFVLRIYTGDGNRYDYAVSTDSMKTARIDMGKGIRARYFAFELISSGQDFDLESLEFVPLVAKRRV